MILVAPLPPSIYPQVFINISPNLIPEVSLDPEVNEWWK